MGGAFVPTQEKRLRILGNYEKENLKVGWRQGLLSSLLCRNKTLTIAAKITEKQISKFFGLSIFA